MKLNKLLFTWMLTLLVLWAKAQEIQQTSSQDTVATLQHDSLPEQTKTHPLRVTSLYAGQIAGLWFSQKDVNDIDIYSSTRLGWWAAYDITKTTSFNAWSIIDLSQKEGETFFLGQAFLASKLGQKRKATLWLAATPVTLLRPFPVHRTGHFETSTDALIPGGAPWFRVDKSGNRNGSAWVAMRKWSPEYGANIWYAADTDKKANLAWRYQDDETFGMVLSGSYKAFSWTFVWNETETQSRLWGKLLYLLDIPWRTVSVAFFTVANRDFEQPQQPMMNGLVGALAVDEVKVGNVPVNIVLWPGYDLVNERIVVYLQLALQK